MAWRWQTMNYTAETMRDFLKKYLGPKLKENKLTETLKVMVLDDGRGLLPGWADTIFNDPEATKYADGVAVHWYGNLYSPAVLLDITQRHHPTKFIFGTEVRLNTMNMVIHESIDAKKNDCTFLVFKFSAGMRGLRYSSWPING